MLAVQPGTFIRRRNVSCSTQTGWWAPEVLEAGFGHQLTDSREYRLGGESAVELPNRTGERLVGEVAKSCHNGGELRWCSFGGNEGSH